MTPKAVKHSEVGRERGVAPCKEMEWDRLRALSPNQPLARVWREAKMAAHKENQV